MEGPKRELLLTERIDSLSELVPTAASEAEARIEEREPRRWPELVLPGEVATMEGSKEASAMPGAGPGTERRLLAYDGLRLVGEAASLEGDKLR